MSDLIYEVMAPLTAAMAKHPCRSVVANLFMTTYAAEYAYTRLQYTSAWLALMPLAVVMLSPLVFTLSLAGDDVSKHAIYHRSGVSHVRLLLAANAWTLLSVIVVLAMILDRIAVWTLIAFLLYSTVLLIVIILIVNVKNKE